MENKYDIVIGLEIHAELNTNSKVFCGCANVFGSKPNTNCCPVCVGMPGALPVVNKAAVEKTIMAGIAMGCEINDIAIFERKNYFYPDLSKAYQISQLVKPICVGGGAKLKSGKYARLNRIHLEEDAGKLLHNAVSRTSHIDYNRGGVPLIEIVTEPDFCSASEAVEFLEEVRSRLIFAGVADCKMEQGGMRCDVNLSLKPKGSKTLGNRTEMKNLNSFKMVTRAIEHESKRQAEILDKGDRIVTETRKWDDVKGKTFAMRNKEESQDYRYFPDPDIYAVKISKDDVARIKKSLPVLAHELREKFIKEFGLPEYDAHILTRDKAISEYFTLCVKAYNKPKAIANLIINDFKVDPKITPNELVAMLKSIEEKKSSAGLPENEIIEVLKKVKTENPKVAGDYVANPDKVATFIIGQVMKQTQGKAKSDVVKKLIPTVFL